MIDGREFLIAAMDYRRSIQMIDGELQARAESEDWHFSRMLARIGATTYITRKVPLSHVGPTKYPNTCAWGEWERDENSIHCTASIEDESGNTVGATTRISGI